MTDLNRPFASQRGSAEGLRNSPAAKRRGSQSVPLRPSFQLYQRDWHAQLGQYLRRSQTPESESNGDKTVALAPS